MAIADACSAGIIPAEVALVISDVADAGILSGARERRLTAEYINPGKYRTKLDETAERAYVDALQSAEVDLVVLAGFMDRECASSAARYGITLDASLITGIDPPSEVESALAAINTAYNQVSSDISLAQAAADQKLVQSRRAVEIETLNAQAEVEPLTALASQLSELKKSGPVALATYVRNVRLKLFNKSRRVIMEVHHEPD